MFSEVYFCKAACKATDALLRIQSPTMQAKEEPEQHLKGHTFLIIHLLNRCWMGWRCQEEEDLDYSLQSQYNND